MTVYINGVAQGGGNVSYTELDGSVNITANALGLGDGAWGAWDLSGTLPVGTKEVDIMLEKLVATDIVGVRVNGSGGARQVTALKSETVTFPTLIISDRIIEIMSNDVSDLDVFRLIGYWS